LAALQAASPGEVRIAWHEWPILGPTSIEAARAALAAKRQGAYVAFQAELMRAGFVPTESLFEDLALRLGLDPGRFAADRRSAEVEQEIATTRALADRFRFPGTPAMVVGRTVVTGSIDDATLRALIARERADGPLDVCAGARPA
ncbi:MAG: DsbA family protein, partial [Pseudomonadota bacterium]